MSLYAIGDLHLSFSTDKPMDVFGPAWANHAQRLADSFSALSTDDVTVVCGDISWGIGLEQTLEDFRFIDALPGKKLILKGNHDYWWQTRAKIEAFFEKNSLNTIDIINNNSFEYENISICGTRGWFYEEEKGDGHDAKIMNRELMRLEASLKSAGGREKLCFLHYPPCYQGYECEGAIKLLRDYGVKRCYYGHLHGPAHRMAVQGDYKGVRYSLVSADYLKFAPLKVL